MLERVLSGGAKVAETPEVVAPGVKLATAPKRVTLSGAIRPISEACKVSSISANAALIAVWAGLFGLMAAEPELARRGIRLRGFGQSVIEAIAGRKVHSPGIVPGGIAALGRNARSAGLPILLMALASLF